MITIGHITTATEALDFIAEILGLTDADRIVPTLTPIAADQCNLPLIASQFATSALSYLAQGEKYMGERRFANFRNAAADIAELAEWI
jgi:hypothetical protein